MTLTTNPPAALQVVPLEAKAKGANPDSKPGVEPRRQANSYRWTLAAPAAEERSRNIAPRVSPVPLLMPRGVS